jgi:DNA-binding response OmpR family regulator
MPRVLVVEDSPTQAQLIKLTLEEAGFQVDLAVHGLEALDAMRRAVPDLVATDLEMPEMNGMQLVEAVRGEYASVPVVLMTAHGSEEIAAIALRKGAASYIPKTFLEDDLVSTVERILALTKGERSHQRALECLRETRSQYVLPNDTELIPVLVIHLDELLVRLNLCDATERIRVNIALQEALLNAIHHGNLEVGSELRQQDEGHYGDLIAVRRQQEPYRSRRAFLDVKATAEEVAFVVRDEGPGFDPSILPDPTAPENLDRIGGRGLLLIRTFMDLVFHNELGNEITLIKRRS